MSGRHEEIVALRERGLTWAYIAEQFGLSTTRVQQIAAVKPATKATTVAARLRADADSPEGFYWRELLRDRTRS